MYTVCIGSKEKSLAGAGKNPRQIYMGHRRYEFLLFYVGRVYQDERREAEKEIRRADVLLREGWRDRRG